MSLHFIFGNSGSGKSRFLYEKIIEESIKHPEKNYIVIVPEQFTMQTQKDLVDLHPDRGIMNIDVLSFRRLAHRIFEEVGADRRTVLTETGKNLMLRKVALEKEDALQVLGGKMSRPGYVSQVKSILSELMQYEITDDELQEMMEFTEKRPLLHAKLSDLRVLYNSFVQYQRDRFMKPEELMDVLCQVADQSGLLKKSILAFDGFTGFTPAQLNVLTELMKLCPKVWITVTIDAGESFFGKISEHELFALSKKMIKHVCGIASEASVSIENPVRLGEKSVPRFREGKALCHLEQNLFRNRQKIYNEDPDELSLHVCTSPAAEVHFAARTICRLVREEGYRYQEIAVITGNLSSYDNYVKKIFPMYQVPSFLDETRHILLNPCLEFVRGALLAAESDFSGETVFRFLRTQMAGVTAEETDRLENYVLAAGIRGRRQWETEWDRLPSGMTPEELVICNEYRQKAMEHLLPFAKKMHRKDASLIQFADALCELMEACQVQQQLKDRELLLMAEGDREEAREYSQIYGILIGLLDEMVDLLGEEKVSSREFMEILDAGFAEARVGIIPPGIDQVQVGDIERSSLAHVKVLFFLGLNDGWVPARGDGGGIVSDMEREILEQTGIELAPSARENSYIQRFYLYQNLTKPEDRLYLSFCESGDNGTAMRPSYLVSVLRRMFPKLAVIREKEIGTSIDQVTSMENGIGYLTGGLEQVRKGKADPAWMELYISYLKEESYRDRVQELVRAAFGGGRKGQLSYRTSRELYGEVMDSSVTRLEQFAACAFAHFAMYGLHLSERQLYGVKPADLGIIFHRSMELFSRQISRDGRDWSEISRQEQEAVMEACVDQVTGEYGNGILHGGAREEYTIRRIKRILCRTAWALHRQICAGKFRPVGFEIGFSDAADLEAVRVRFGEEGMIRLQGRIDRIDTAEDDDTVYVKIVDYKSGTAKFDPVSLYYGLQLQLVVYMNAALEMEGRMHQGKKVVPAGIFYYHLDDPLLDKETGLSPAETEEKLLKKLRPEGLLNSDGQILQMMDQNLAGDSLVIPAGLKKDGTLKAASSAVTTTQFEQLSGYVSGKMTEMAGRILEGEVAAEPFVLQNRSACDYCMYAEVCGFDRKLPGLCRIRTAGLTADQVWERIAQEQEEKDGSSMDG